MNINNKNEKGRPNLIRGFSVFEKCDTEFDIFLNTRSVQNFHSFSTGFSVFTNDADDTNFVY
jgi:hypothetical protein